MSIPFIDLKSQYQTLKPRIQARIDTVLEHGQYIMGPEVRELEERLESYTGAGHCVTVASGTEALLISLMSLGIGPGDEVITTPFSFIATAEVIVLLGATPVFVDIEADTCNIDAARIKDKITSRTRAIMPVSLYGQPADMDEINAIARDCGDIPVIEDAAQSFGARYNGRQSCNLSTIGCTSFFPSKPLGCYGDGGAIFTSDPAIAEKCRQLRVHGQTQRYVHEAVGVGGRMDTLQCAIVLAKLDDFDREVEQRQQVARRYYDLLDTGLENARLLRWPSENRSSVFAQFSLLVENRDEVRARLQDMGVPTAVHYPVPISEQPAYRGFAEEGGAPIAAAVSREILSLPMHPGLDEETQSVIAERFRQSQCT